VATLVLLTSASAPRAASPDWTLRRDADGVRVWTRPVEGSAYREFRGKMEVRAPIARAVAWIGDAPRMPEWFFRCSEARLVERVSPVEGYSYSVIDLPWPFAERDIVVQWRIADAPGGATVVPMENAPDRLPAQPGRVRVPRASGLWRLTPRGDGVIEVELQLHFEPAGRLPAWIANAVVVDMPYWTLRNLRDRLATGRPHPDEARLERERLRGPSPVILPDP
jgi:hypothetical protein